MQNPAGRPPLARPGSGRSVIYRYYVLFVLMVTYGLNFVDRSIVATLGQPIKRDLGLTDLQLGLLNGLAFAVLYSLAAIPLARLAEHRNRARLIAAAVGFWSLMTIVCGLSRSYGSLLAARVGVGFGEAGGAPASQSILADYFPAERRGVAMAVFSMGIPLGVMFGAIVSGRIAEATGWREAFMIVGAPGIALALVIRLTVRDQPRSLPSAADEVPAFLTVLKSFLTHRALLYACLGGVSLSLATYGWSSFYVPLLQRWFHLRLSVAASIHGVTQGATLMGMWLGGALADHFGKRSARAYAIVPAVGIALGTVLLAFALSQSTLIVVVLAVAAGNIMLAAHIGPMWAIVHNQLGPKARASAVAFFLLLFTLVGLGFGPLLVGAVSDQMSVRSEVAEVGRPFHTRAPGCAGRLVPAPGRPPRPPECTQDPPAGLRAGLSLILVFAGGAAVFFGLAALELSSGKAGADAGRRVVAFDRRRAH